jgi:hypothetical protein
MTDEGRRKRILDALNAWQQKSDPKESLSLPWRGRQELFPVVELDLTTPLLNAKSHRLRSQLESHPQGQMVLQSPWSPKAQEVIAELLRSPLDRFERLKENLAHEGQRQPGVITREGVLMNANRRAVALRDLGEPQKHWIRVAVLPIDAEPPELAELELSLQLQEELKTPYSLTNELLFIEELARVYHMTDEQIAINLRWTANANPTSVKKGATEVAQRRRILALIRDMQRLANPLLPLTFFDEKLEQLKALEEKYSSMVQEEPFEALRFREAWLATALSGSASVHDLRAVYDEDFVESYLLPRLSEQEVLREHVEELLTPVATTGTGLPGVDDLAPEDADESEQHSAGINFRPMINILSPASNDNTVTMPNGEILDRTLFKDTVRQAVKKAVDDWRVDQRAERGLDAPVDQMRQAVMNLRKALSAYQELKGKELFEQTRRGKFNYHFKQLRKLVKQFEEIENNKGTSKA